MNWEFEVDSKQFGEKKNRKSRKNMAAPWGGRDGFN
jgi:hypothetical protein